jgi:succinate dehydrogenase / fumarate reductase flavoprotein subunit
VGIFRVKADLVEALKRIAAIRERSTRLKVSGGRAFNPGWNLVFEVRNLIDISEAITRSALQRTESRGAHSRLDHPATEKAWSKKNIVVCLGEDRLVVSTTPTLPIPDDLRAIAEAGGGT